jgi:hypothetical protein
MKCNLNVRRKKFPNFSCMYHPYECSRTTFSLTYIREGKADCFHNVIADDAHVLSSHCGKRC